MILGARERNAGDFRAGEGGSAQLRDLLPAPDVNGELLAGVLLHGLGPGLQLFEDVGGHSLRGLSSQPLKLAHNFSVWPYPAHPGRQVGLARKLSRRAALLLHRGRELIQSRLQMLRLARLFGDAPGLVAIGPNGFGNLRQIPNPLRRHHRSRLRRRLHPHLSQHALTHRQPLGREQPAQMLVERRHAVIVEPGRAGAVDRHLLPRHPERLAVSRDLLGHISQRILRAPPLELVDRDHVGEVEHVDLLQLRRGAELGRHHVERHVSKIHDAGVALPDTRCLDDHQVVTRCPTSIDNVWQVAGTWPPAPRVASERKKVRPDSREFIRIRRPAGLPHPAGGSGPPRSRRSVACPADRCAAAGPAHRSATTYPTRPCR